MKRETRIALWVHPAGALLCELLLPWEVYDDGGFHRDHSGTQLGIAVLAHTTISLLWPVMVATLILQVVGVLPRQITLHF